VDAEEAVIREVVVREQDSLPPPLKWAGGKRWLVPRLRELYEPHRHRRLVEPFVGGMAVALGLSPERALLNDVNHHLINFYCRLTVGGSFVIAMMNDERFYYAQRAFFNSLINLPGGRDTNEAAEIFYYLNRTGFNGLCRFNGSGEFNVPFGRYASIDYRRDFAAYASVLKKWEIRCGDFYTLDVAADDFVYLDPPYDGTFTDYSAGGFSWDDQVHLADCFASHSGPVVASNQATDRVMALYRNRGFRVELIEVRRRISANGDRTPAVEMLATRNVGEEVR
jgi:DNA adenine methylase